MREDLREQQAVAGNGEVLIWDEELGLVRPGTERLAYIAHIKAHSTRILHEHILHNELRVAANLFVVRQKDQCDRNTMLCSYFGEVGEQCADIRTHDGFDAVANRRRVEEWLVQMQFRSCPTLQREPAVLHGFAPHRR